jgi:hypothetical protein
MASDRVPGAPGLAFEIWETIRLRGRANYLLVPGGCVRGGVGGT